MKGQRLPDSHIFWIWVTREQHTKNMILIKHCKNKTFYTPEATMMSVH